jgi:hypothetical protein
MKNDNLTVRKAGLPPLFREIEFCAAKLKSGGKPV